MKNRNLIILLVAAFAYGAIRGKCSAAETATAVAVLADQKVEEAVKSGNAEEALQWSQVALHI